MTMPLDAIASKDKYLESDSFLDDLNSRGDCRGCWTLRI